ncbi:YjbF family lipoprotein [Paenirhodobacter sp.]|uniref:YjbF family lipoprotein n=1 Tax=Paenirhodobacter sp. TaxID=1965326 RepID=UPI003B40F880
MKSRIGALLLAVALGGCGSESDKLAGPNLVKEGAMSVASAAMFWKKKPPAKPVDAEAMARGALELNKGPLILASFETGYTDIFGMVGENGAMRTYNSPGSRAIILRGGMLAGTRGFGFDMMSAETEGTGRLIRARQAGQAKKVLRYLDGLGLERPLPLDCAVATGASTTYPFAGQSWSGQQVVERCTGSGLTITNTFIVSAEGRVVSSRQWVTPQVGYITIQTVRP